jgi:hypothetical protein
MEFQLGYAPRAALERLRVANAIVDLPQIAEALTTGELSFSGARELTRVATAQTEGEWLSAITDKNLREVEHLVSGHTPGDLPTDPPDPARRRETLRFEVSPETYALLRQVQQILDTEHGERLDDDALLATLCRHVLDTRAAARTSPAYQVAVTVCSTCKKGAQDGAGIVVDMSPAAVDRAQCDAHDIGSVDDGQSARATSAIPPATRRKVLRRDHGTCRATGCRSSRNVDIHHITPRAGGGDHSPSNLLTLCEAHHLALHEGTLTITGTAPDLVFTRGASTAFANASHAVDTAKALRTLGFKPHEVADAMKNVRAHVGNAPHTIEQWLSLALRYCPRPTS